MDMSGALMSKASDDWATPPDFYADLDREFGFTFDPCPLLSLFDGLAIDWNGRVFCNPPYSKITQFVRKAVEEVTAGRAECVVFLVPSRTDTRWFHNHIYGKAELRFVKGRLKFGGARNNAPFPSMVAVLRR